jgi:DNA-binding NarL/FixJ family response regulator
MKHVYLADAHIDERLAFRILLQNIQMQVVGEADDWSTVLAQAPATRPDMVLLEWGLVTAGSGGDLSELRRACPAAVVIVLTSQLEAREKAALSAGADAFISRGETADRVVERLRTAVGGVVLDNIPWIDTKKGVVNNGK